MGKTARHWGQNTFAAIFTKKPAWQPSQTPDPDDVALLAICRVTFDFLDGLLRTRRIP